MPASSAVGFAGAIPFGLSSTAVAGAISLLLLGCIYKLLRGGRTNGRSDNGQVAEKEEPAPQVVIEPLHDFDWRAVEPKQFRHFKRVYHITMGLQADNASDLITVDRDYLDRVKHRRHLIEKHGSGVHGCLPGGVAAVSELYTFLMSEYLPTRFPSMFGLSNDGKHFTNHVTGKAWPTAPPEDAATALRVLGETVEEDMFLLHETPEGHKSFAFVCCFPSGFDPSAKVGKLLKDIHAPVPSYEKIGASMERFFAKMQVGKSVKRLNWAIQTHGELYNSSGNHMTSEEAEEMAQDADINIDESYYRVELQTLTRLPRTQALLFSFKTYLYPLRQIKEEGLGGELADAVDGLEAGNAPGTWVYKGAARWSERVCEYLRA